MQYQCAQSIGWMTIENCYREEKKGERVRGRMRKEKKKEENMHLIHTCVEVHAGVLGIFTYLILKPTLQDDIIPAVEMRNQKLAV